MKPIIMGTESVRAILEGRKTQTRRVVKADISNCFDLEHDGTLQLMEIEDRNGDLISIFECCPYGKVGDRLWVREEWKPGAWSNDGRVAIDYQASPELTHTPWICMEDQASKFIPRWLNEISEIGLIPNHEDRYEWEPGKSPFKWKRAMYMPRFASRITLEITDIRVERLQDISEEDAKAEGIKVLPLQDESDPSAWYQYAPGIFQARSATKSYELLWNSLNAKRGYPWEKNPWVWVISFKRVHDQKEG